MPLQGEDFQYGINWRSFSDEEWGFLSLMFPRSTWDERKRALAELSNRLETSTRLALDALRALDDEGFVIIPEEN